MIHSCRKQNQNKHLTCFQLLSSCVRFRYHSRLSYSFAIDTSRKIYLKHLIDLTKYIITVLYHTVVLTARSDLQHSSVSMADTHFIVNKHFRDTCNYI